MKLVVQGNPIPLKRARIGYGRVYDSQKGEKQDFLNVCVSSQMITEIQKPFKAVMKFYCQIPESWSKKKKKEMNGQFKPTRPDTDNYIKFVLDALTPYYKDDALMVHVIAYKRYSDNPRTEVIIEEIL